MSSQETPLSIPPCSLVWFRNDLRVLDNEALNEARKNLRGERLRVVALYIISPKDYEEYGYGPKKVDFILRSLRALGKSLQSLRIPLLIRVAEDPSQIPSIVSPPPAARAADGCLDFFFSFFSVCAGPGNCTGGKCCASIGE